MGSFAYAIGQGLLVAYDVQSDGSLTPLGEPVPVSSQFHNYMCACGDTVFALSQDNAPRIAYLDIYQVDRASGRLIPRVQRHRLAGFQRDDCAMAATSFNGEAFYIFFGENRTLHSYMYAPRFKTVLPVGQLDRPDDGGIMQLEFDETGRTLYACLGSTDYIVASYAINDNGMPAFIDRAPYFHSSSFSFAVDPIQRFIYVGNLLPSKVLGYTVSGGMFTPIDGVAEHIIAETSAMKVSPDGKYMFLTTGANPLDGARGNTVVSHSIHPETGLLTLLNVRQDDSLVLSLAITPDSKYLYAASEQTGEIYRYAIDNGKLSPRSVVANTGVKNDKFLLVSDT